MSEVKTIKGIDEDTWAEFKGISARNKVKAATMFKLLIEEYKSHTKHFWEEIFAHKPIFTPKEHAEIKKRVEEMRKEYGWRI